MPATIRLPGENGNFSPSILVDDSDLELETISINRDQEVGLGFCVSQGKGGDSATQNRNEAHRILQEKQIATRLPLNDSMVMLTNPAQLLDALQILGVGEQSAKRVVHYVDAELNRNKGKKPPLPGH